MATMLLSHYEVADRARFLEEFDAFEPGRARAGGITRGLLESAGEGPASRGPPCRCPAVGWRAAR